MNEEKKTTQGLGPPLECIAEIFEIGFQDFSEATIRIELGATVLGGPLAGRQCRCKIQPCGREGRALTLPHLGTVDLGDVMNWVGKQARLLVSDKLGFEPMAELLELLPPDENYKKMVEDAERESHEPGALPDGAA